MDGLIPAGDGPVARCKVCGATAVGPCARCRGAICGDCCELTEGGATTFAVCKPCIRRGGGSLLPAWFGLLGWLGAIVLALVAVAVAMTMLR